MANGSFAILSFGWEVFQTTKTACPATVGAIGG